MAEEKPKRRRRTRKKKAETPTPEKKAKPRKRRTHMESFYVKPEECRYCRKPGKLYTKTTKPAATYIIRYKECGHCGHGWKEMEDRLY